MTYILAAEDNPADASLLRIALGENAFPIDVITVPDGEATIRALRQEGEYTDHPRPQLVLLDLSLPRLDGREVLRTLREDARIAVPPVLVWSSSAAPKDVAECYRLGASAFVAKPVDLDQYLRVVGSVVHFWLTVARLPSGSTIH